MRDRLRFPGLELQLLCRAVEDERVALSGHPDVGHLAPPLRRAYVGLERVVGPVRRSDKRAAALEDGVERLLLEHLLTVEGRDDEPSRHGVRPPGRNRAIGVAVEILRPRQRVRHPRARLARQAAYRRLDQPGLLDGLVGDRDGTVSDRALETFERPGRLFLSQESP